MHACRIFNRMLRGKNMKLQDLTGLLAEKSDGIDAVAVICPVNLSGPLDHTLGALSAGYIPESYRWTPEKTAYAYSYKSYRTWVKSIVVAAKYYFTDEKYSDDPGRGRIARFTWRNNYGYLKMKLAALIDVLQVYTGARIQSRVLSNYTSIPEKALFSFSKLGSIGKNSVAVSRNMGSFFVTGEALTDLEVADIQTCEPRRPDFSMCGSCRACIDACPTGAIVADGVVDINRCFQYMSENLIPVPRDLRRRWGNRLYGCSICIDICPFNSALEPSAERHNVGYVGQDLSLIDLLSMSDAQWQAVFRNNQIGIRGRRAIEKNALLALGCLQYKKVEEILETFLGHENPVLRISAAWSLGRLRTKGALASLERKYREETELNVRDEIELSIQGI